MRTQTAVLCVLVVGGMVLPGTVGCGQEGAPQGKVIALPAPMTEGGMSLTEAMTTRRSVRSYTEQALTLEEISQLAWAAQGITEPTRGFRTAPSAGALYPLELYLLTEEGVFHYLPQGHRLEQVQGEDRRARLAEAALGQQHVATAALDVVVAAVFERTERKYGKRAQVYVYIEAGHAAQNVHLQAVALGLGSCSVGALREEGVREALNLPAGQEPLYILTVGHEGRR